MGMYSSVDWSEVEFKGRTSKVNFEDWLSDLKCPDYVDDKGRYSDGVKETYVSEKKRVKEAWEKSKGNIEEFIQHWLDNSKIIQYWYEGFCYVLRDVAMFFEGEIHLTYEENNEFWNIHFNDGYCLLEQGMVEWKDKVDIDNKKNGFISELPNKEKLFRSI